MRKNLQKNLKTSKYIKLIAAISLAAYTLPATAADAQKEKARQQLQEKVAQISDQITSIDKANSDRQQKEVQLGLDIQQQQNQIQQLNDQQTKTQRQREQNLTNQVSQQQNQKAALTAQVSQLETQMNQSNQAVQQFQNEVLSIKQRWGVAEMDILADAQRRLQAESQRNEELHKALSQARVQLQDIYNLDQRRFEIDQQMQGQSAGISYQYQVQKAEERLGELQKQLQKVKEEEQAESRRGAELDSQLQRAKNELYASDEKPYKRPQ
jgi:chromosome segregation ATPase